MTSGCCAKGVPAITNVAANAHATSDFNMRVLPFVCIIRSLRAETFEYAVDHDTGLAKIIARIAQVSQLCRVQVLRDLAIFGEQIEQRALLPDRLAAEV